jgi:hypothetical protein
MSAGHRLPLEIIEQICILAAEDDRKCANRMAYVSRAICQATTKARWRVIVITSIPQYMAFYREIHAVADKDYNTVVQAFRQASDDPSLHLRTVKSLYPGGVQIGLHNDENGGKVLNSIFDLIAPAANKELRMKRRGRTISSPNSAEPHESIRHLYIAIRDPNIASQPLRDLGNNWGPLTDGWDALNDVCQAAFKAYLKSSGSLDTTSRHSLDSGNFLFHGLDDLYLKHLSVPAGAESVIGGIKGSCTVKEITAVFTPYTHIRTLLKKSLERLHLIGLDASSKASGIPPPWDELEYASIVGSESLQLTHLRYDTRKFSFKPAEIFATRLRPLLQEMTIESAFHPTAEGKVDDTYRHSGPRHAAPSRGAGHSGAQGDRTSTLVPVHQMRGDPRADILREKLGVGRLDFVQFAWDPMSTGEKREEDVPPHQRVRYSAESQQDETGGWPREMRGAWTERSDRDVAPSFAVELRDAINSLYGWHTPGVEPAGRFVARKDAMPLEDRKTAKNVAFSPDSAGEMVSRMRNGYKQGDQAFLANRQRALTALMQIRCECLNLDIPCKLQYGVRAPQSLIHLGGKAPFEPEDRLALFEDRARSGKGAWP